VRDVPGLPRGFDLVSDVGEVSDVVGDTYVHYERDDPAEQCPAVANTCSFVQDV
jgi:hypothetical protein